MRIVFVQVALAFSVLGPCQQAARLPGSPLVVGDSVVLAAASYLHQRGLGVDARGCRQMAEGLRVVSSSRRSVVLALGANGRVSMKQLDQGWRAARRLVLVTPGGVPDGDRGRILRFARDHRLRVVDWGRHSKGADPRGLLQPDSLHLTDAGARALAREIARATR